VTSGDQALNDAVVIAANFGGAEKPVVSTRSCRAQRALEMACLDGRFGVALEKSLQPHVTPAHAGQRLRQRLAREQAHPVASTALVNQQPDDEVRAARLPLMMPTGTGAQCTVCINASIAALEDGGCT
jgi:hypothetical protein